MPHTLLERDAEIDAIAQAMTDAVAGAFRTVVVRGQAGIGKTALLDAARAIAAERGFTQRSSVFTVLSATASHSVLWDWFAVDADRLDGPARTVAAFLETGTAPHPAMLTYGTQWAVAATSDEAPLLLVADDLHWADAGSRRLIADLALRLRGEPVVLLLAARPDADIDDDPAYCALLAARTTTLLTPKPLSARAVEELTVGSNADAAEIHRLSGGIPFYVSELIMADAGATPDRIQSALRARLSLLNPEAREVADLLAAGGGTLPGDILERLSANDPTSEATSALTHALDQLTTAAIATRDRDEVTMTHPIVTEAIRAGFDAPRSEHLHERISRALREAGAPAAAVAAHELLAAPDGDRERAARLRDAGEAAERAGTPAIAAQYFERALAEGGESPRERAQLLFAVGRARVLEGEGDIDIEGIATASPALDDPVERGTNWAQLGDLAYMAGDVRTSARAYELARAALDEAHRAESGEEAFEARMLRAKILANEITFAPEAAGTLLAFAEDAATATRADDRADAALYAVAALALTLSAGPSETARDYALRAYNQGLAPGGADDPISYMLSGALNYLGLYEEGDAWLTAALDDARARGSVFGFGTASYARGGHYLRYGHLRAALADLEASWSTIGLGWHTYFYPIRHYLVLALLRAGDGDRAREVAAVEPRGEGATFSFLDPMTRIEVALVTGDTATAARLGAELLGREQALTAGGVDWRVSTAKALGRRNEEGDLERARMLLHDALADAERLAHPMAHAGILLDLAEFAEEQSTAEALYRRAMLAAGDQARYERAQAQIALGEIAARHGDAEKARRLVTAALDYAQREGARPLRDRAHTLLARVRAGEIDPRADLVSLLTAGEHRIALAAAAGATNRQIAESHFVTLKTVEFHLANAYRKLGITRRSELASILSEPDARSQAG